MRRPTLVQHRGLVTSVRAGLHGLIIDNDCRSPTVGLWWGPMRSPSDLADAFRSSGRKLTPQRERIFRVLHENPTHPTAEAVHAEVVADMPSVSLRTVYATPHDLADMGELVQLDLGTGSCRFDPNVSDHHPLVDRKRPRLN